MFYIYSPQGQVFAGTLEQLRRVNKSTKTPASRIVQDKTHDQVEDSLTDNLYTVPKQALTQYQQMLEQQQEREAIYHAYQIMSHPVISLPASYSIQQAVELFQQYPFQLLPVVDNSQTLIATLSRRKLYEQLLETPQISHSFENKLFQLLDDNDKHVISAAPVTDIRRITAALLEHQLDAMPILEETGNLIGIVSRTDILQCVTSDPPLSLWC